MGWFIAQSLGFIIIAALIGLAIGIWIGWLVWGRRAKGKHLAEKAEQTSAVAAGDKAKGTDSPVGTDTVLPVADSATEPASDGDSAGTTDGEPVDDSDTPKPAKPAEPAVAESEADGAAEPEPEEAQTDVVAEAEAVTKAAAEASDADSAEDAEDDAETTGAETTGAAEAAPVADDLRRIEGIGPKIAAALAAAGYPTYAKIAAASEDELRKAVAGQGIRFAPSASSWADQAKYLVDSDADGLEEYQDYLIAGQDRAAKFKKDVDYADVDEIDGTDAKEAALATDEAAAAAEPEPEPEPQDLRRIEGIGPKIEAVLQAAGYTTYAKVAGANEEEIRVALSSGGIKFAPAAASWADQAKYLVDGDENGLQEYQDYLIGGQDRAAKFKKDVDYADVDEIDGTDAKAAALATDEAAAAAEPEPEVKA